MRADYPPPRVLAAMRRSTNARNCAGESARSRSACAFSRQSARVDRPARGLEAADRRRDRLRRLRVEEHAGGSLGPASRTVSRTPPRPKAITGVPHACASIGQMPKSSSAAKTNARAPRSSSRMRSRETWPANSTFGPAAARCARAPDPSPTMTSWRSGQARETPRRSRRCACRAPARRGDVVAAAPRAAAGREEVGVDRRVDRPSASRS